MFNVVHTFEDEEYRCRGSSNEAAISTHSQYIVVGSDNGTVVAFDVASKKVESKIKYVHTSESIKWFLRILKNTDYRVLILIRLNIQNNTSYFSLLLKFHVLSEQNNL